MKQFKKLKTISYCVYEPNHVPTKSKYYDDIDTLKKAKRIARKLGIGSEIVANLRLKNKSVHGTYTMWSSIYELELKDGYFVKFDLKMKMVDGKRYYKKEISTRHSLT